MTDAVSRRDCANAIRVLSMDAVQQAGSGHPGAPMGMADIAEVLWRDYLRHNPANPGWFNRDRFVLSNGHGSMLLYALLHLSGYDLPMTELQHFRQLHSATPGHPEYGDTPGVETTTGPLGQGLANGVGMAIAEKTLAAQFNRQHHPIVDHHTWVFVGDGCLMEGISHEVCSLAGTLQLGKLIVFYDDNGISIDGEVEEWFTDDTAARFRAYGWQVLHADGHDPAAISSAIAAARAEHGKPSLISCRTVIGFGSPNKGGTAATHGAPLGEDEVAAVRQQLDWPHQPFLIPAQIKAAWDGAAKGARLEAEWQQQLTAYQAAWPELATELQRRISGQLPDQFPGQADRFIQQCQARAEAMPSRKASQQCIEAYGALLPELIGGSADLTGSNLTIWSGSTPISRRDDGNYIFYGVREFGMSAIASGIALHGGFIPYSATFLIFMEYARNAVRMAALMRQHSIFVYTHDSIGQGEDGPTHQPVEQLTTLRVTPNLSVWRPADSVEAAVAWKAAIERSQGPTALVFSRQSLPHLERSTAQLAAIARGGYVLRDCTGQPELLLIATGSEVSICVTAWSLLQRQGIQARLISMPSVDVFETQEQAYRDQVLPPGLRRRLAVEAGAADYWYKLVGLDGKILGMQGFGASAPGKVLMAHFGFTPQRVAALAGSLLS